jgi:hypothetical protein
MLQELVMEPQLLTVQEQYSLLAVLMLEQSKVQVYLMLEHSFLLRQLLTCTAGVRTLS